MKKVLIPTDFSSTSKQAIHYILDLIKKYSLPSRIFLLNAYLLPGQSSGNEKVIETLDNVKAVSKNKLNQQKEEILQNLDDQSITIETLSYMGSLRSIIPHTIKELGIDLLVMGEDGGKHVQALSETLKESGPQCPILTVFKN